jgi:hypothetical protein
MPSDDPIVQSHITAANAAEAGQNHDARAAAATAALDAWKASMQTVPSATPKDAVEAGQRLDFLTKNKSFQDRFMAGETSARREFELLSSQVATADPVSLAIGGVTPPDGLDENNGTVAGGRELV